ncbi:translation initiation factor IF-2-like [Cygnus olor]|uniref:translation initiation factor IF-2-like n=1 Tax=Cygnus olor TaxID=8869 RepID=UPI001ADE534C|nr:translation initiation factor IF-2-like [Cygnus olor]
MLSSSMVRSGRAQRPGPGMAASGPGPRPPGGCRATRPRRAPPQPLQPAPPSSSSFSSPSSPPPPPPPPARSPLVSGQQQRRGRPQLRPARPGAGAGPRSRWGSREASGCPQPAAGFHTEVAAGGALVRPGIASSPAGRGSCTNGVLARWRRDSRSVGGLVQEVAEQPRDRSSLGSALGTRSAPYPRWKKPQASNEGCPQNFPSSPFLHEQQPRFTSFPVLPMMMIIQIMGRLLDLGLLRSPQSTRPNACCCVGNVGPSKLQVLCSLKDWAQTCCSYFHQYKQRDFCIYFFFHFIKIISSILFCYNEALEVNYKDKKQLLSSLLFHLQDVLVQWKEIRKPETPGG